MNLTFSKIAGWLFVAGGAVALLCSLPAYFHTRARLRSETATDGVIARLVDGASDNVHYPIYWFRDANGRGRLSRIDVGKHSTSGQPGDTVKLLYPEDHWQEAAPYHFRDVWGDAMKLAEYGAFALLFGLGVLFFGRE